MYQTLEITVDVRWIRPQSPRNKAEWYVYLTRQGVCPLHRFPDWINGDRHRPGRQANRVNALVWTADSQNHPYRKI